MTQAKGHEQSGSPTKNQLSPTLIPGFSRMLHGGDYNPDQWLGHPEIIDEDFRLAKLAGVNTFSIGIFAWSALEPAEGIFQFDWLDDIMDRMADAGMKAVLATPSGAKPNWMAAKYPEIRRINSQGLREPQQARHNHCFTSPVYREKVTILNTRLAERYAKHPALGMWHISNEFSGECHCDLCKAWFRQWLEKKYGSLDKLNAAWWTGFWSHTFSDWNQITAIDSSVHGLELDWKRFVSDQITDFIVTESAPLRKLTPQIPVTTNLMGVFFPVDYRRLAKVLDVVSWDNYPEYHSQRDMPNVAAFISFTHDLTRCLKPGRTFAMMESSPSAVNWMKINKLLSPGIHLLKSLQAVAHGSDSVQYFQWRKGRGGSEKFHGAVVDHVGHEHTRVFGEVAQVGDVLGKLSDVVCTATPAQTAIIYDWENRWILEAAAGPRRGVHDPWVMSHYHPLWQNGVPTDVIGVEDDFSKYQLLIAPMLYMLKPGVAHRLKQFVTNGGILLTGFLTGIADENDTVFTTGWPGPLREMLGIWAEEIDYLHDYQSNRLVSNEHGLALGLARAYRTHSVCDLIHAEQAKILATYGDDFYAGRPCLTVNQFGKGRAYYLATRTDDACLVDLLAALTRELKIQRALPTQLPPGVTAQIRTDGKNDFIFIMNFNSHASRIDNLPGNQVDLLDGSRINDQLELPAYGCRVVKKPCSP